MDLEDFFNSYDLSAASWSVNCHGIIYNVDAEILKNSVLGKSSTEQNKIAGTIRSLIFREMPLNAYLEALAIELINEAHNSNNV